MNEKTPKRKLKMTLAILVLAALFVVELYFMINYSTEYLVLGVIGLVMLCLVYIITDQAFKLGNDKAEIQQKEYESLFKSEKVSYVSMKTSFLELEKVLEEVRANSAFPVEELIKAQKATAKVTIQRSKENANAIMNSNDKVIDNMVSFGEQLLEIKQVVEAGKNVQGDTSSQVNEDILAKQQEMLDSVRELEDSIKNEISKLSDSLEKKMSEISVVAPATQEVGTAASVVEESMIPQGSQAVEEPVMPEEAVITEEPVMPEEAVASEEAVIPEEAVMSEEPVMPEEAVMPEEPVMSEEAVIPEELMVSEEPAKQITAPSSDPNHIMTPEEIAALLGEVDSILEEPEPEPVVEEKPPMPDLSDPGHVMTPEEIAALLANM